MVGAADCEMLLGFMADGLYEIFLRPGKFFFRKKKFFFNFFLFFMKFFNRVNV